MSLQVEWKGHELQVTGNWTWRWLYLAPVYELRIDGELVDRAGGPRVHPRLEAIVEDEEGSLHHVAAELTSIVGYKPSCELSVEGDVIRSEKLRVQNFLNPFLILFILSATGLMIYLGPDVIRSYWP